MQLLNAMSMRSRAMLGVSILAVLVVGFLLFRVASQPSYATILSGVDPAETGKVTAALDAQGIGYKLENNGTALAVEKGSTAQARIALASQGLGSGAKQPGYELLEKQKLGSSDFQQKVAYQRALEGEIARTVDGISGVGGAQVQLSLPEDDLFADEQKPVTAAVLLGGEAGSIEQAQVKGIANLVASSVEGLKAEKVTITDGGGQLLWPASEGAAGGEGGTAKAAAEARYNSGLEATLNAMLVRTLGPGKAQVQARADLNVDEATVETLSYDREGTPQTQKEETEELEGGQGGAGGTAGANANLANGTANGAGGAGSNYNKESSETNFALGKQVERIKRAPGAVERLNVALVLDKSIDAKTAAQIRNTVSTAAGIDTDRGDAITMSQVAFAKQPAATDKAAGPVPAGAVGYAKWAGLGLGALLFLFFTSRALRRREDDALGPEPTWLREIETPRAIAELGAGAGAPAPGTPASRAAVETAVQQQPDKVAQQVQSWLREEEPV